MIRHCIIAIAAAIASSLVAVPAAADSPAGYIDEVANYTSASDEDLRRQVEAAVSRAGYAPTFAAADRAPCEPGDTSCLGQRARAAGAVIAVRTTWVEVAGELSVAVEVVDARRQRASQHKIRRGDFEAAANLVAAFLSEEKVRFASGGSSNRAAWSLAGVSVALAVGGGASTLHAWRSRGAFFRDHIDDGGDIVGISPGDARSAETRARVWSVAGAALLAGAAASGLTAGVMFARDGSDGSVVVGGRF